MLSIRTQISIALNILVLGVGIAIGWFSLNVMSDTLQEQVLSRPARNFAGLVDKTNLPLTDQLMHQISDVMECEVAVISSENSNIVCASLPKRKIQPLAKHAGHQQPSKFAINDVQYRLSAPTPVSGIHQYNAGQQAYLIMLMPETRWKAERHAAWFHILTVTLSALAIATVIGILFTGKIARPIEALARHMDHMFEHSSRKHVEPETHIAAFHGCPGEVEHLRQSFNNLLARLRRSQANLESAAKMATTAQLSAAVAHEIRNPLSGIKMNVHVLADRLDQRNQTENNEIKKQILQNIDRIDMFVKELMRVAVESPENKEAGTEFPREANTVSLIDISNDMSTLLYPQCRHAGVTVKYDFNVDAQWVYANAEDIRQVVLNLLLNAIEAVDSQGGEITLSTQQSEDHFVRYSIEDNGPGISPEMGQKIFEPLVTTKEYGTGLGLFVCRQIIHRNNGRIGFNNLQNGTIFWFELPADSDYE